MSPRNALSTRVHAIRWMLLLVTVHVVPVPWFLFVTIGFVPPAALLWFGLANGLAVAPEAWAAWPYFILPAVVVCAAFYLPGMAVAWFLARLQPPVFRSLLVLLSVGAPCLLVFQPLYGVGASLAALPDFLSAAKAFLGWYLGALGTVIAWLLVVQHVGTTGPVGRAWHWFIGTHKAWFWGGLAACLLLAFVGINRAVLICRPLAGQGIASAQYCLAQARASSDNPYLGSDSARDWYRRAAMRGHRDALWYMVEWSRGSDRERWLRILARQGDGQAQYELSRSMSPGGGDGDAAKRALLARAAEGGNAQAQYELAVKHARRVSPRASGPANREAAAEARRWLERAAENDHAGAVARMAAYHARGSMGYPLDFDRARALFRRADALRAASGERGRVGVFGEVGRDYAFAIEQIDAWEEGLMLLDTDLTLGLGEGYIERLVPGPGVRERGVRLLRNLAEAGEEQAALTLNRLLLHHLERPEEAAEILLLSAGQEGNVRALERVVSGYFNGNYGFDVDYAEAEPHIRRLLAIYRRERYGARPRPGDIHRLEGYLDFIAGERAAGRVVD